MISPDTAIVTVALVALALVVSSAGLFAARRLRAFSRAARAADERLANLAVTQPASARHFEERLGVIRAGTENALWSLARIDARLEALTGQLAARRMELDRQRRRMLEARHWLHRLRGAARLIIRAIELRRVFLG